MGNAEAGAILKDIGGYRQSSMCCIATDFGCHLQSHPDLAVTSLTIHRLIITAVMLAAKLMDDKYYNNAFYAKIGGITTSELNLMELEMLRMLDFRTFVSHRQLKELLGRLDAFQVPGHLISVLCRKRFSCTPDSNCASPGIHEGMQKPKMTKSHIVTRQLQQPLQYDTNPHRIASQTSSDLHCNSAQPVSSTVSKSECALSTTSIVCSQLLPSRLASNCLTLRCPAVIDVTA